MAGQHDGGFFLTNHRSIRTAGPQNHDGGGGMDELACANTGALFFLQHLMHVGVETPNVVKLCQTVQPVIDEFRSRPLQGIREDEWQAFFDGPRVRKTPKGRRRTEAEVEGVVAVIVEWLGLLLQKRLIARVALPPDYMARIDTAVVRRAGFKVASA